MPFMKNQFSIFFGGLLILANIGCSGDGESEKSPEAAKTSAPQVSNDSTVAKTPAPPSSKDLTETSPKQQENEAGKPPDDAPVEKMPVAEFVKLTESTKPDELLKKFEGKWVELSGIVTAIEPVKYGPRKGVNVHLTERGKFLEDTAVQCFTRDLRFWDHFSFKDSVILRGILAKEGEIVLDHCKLISTTGKPVPRVSAEDIAKTFAESPDTAESKFMAPRYIVTGKVKSIGGYDHLYLEGNDKYDVKLEEYNGASNFKVGDMITLMGVVTISKEPKEGSHLRIKHAWDITEMDRKE